MTCTSITAPNSRKNGRIAFRESQRSKWCCCSELRSSVVTNCRPETKQTTTSATCTIVWITGLFRVCTARSCKDVAALLVGQPGIIASSLRTLRGAAARKEGRNRTAWSFRWPAAGGNEQCGGQRTVGCPCHLQEKCHFRHESQRHDARAAADPK